MNPTPAAIALIRAQVTDWIPSDQVIADALNTPTIANPTPQPQAPRVMAESELAALLTDPSNDSLIKLLNWVNFGLVKRDIEINNHAGVAQWAMKLALCSIIVSTEATAIQAYAISTVGDPTWQSLVSWATVNLGRLVDDADIQAARPA